MVCWADSKSTPSSRVSLLLFQCHGYTDLPKMLRKFHHYEPEARFVSVFTYRGAKSFDIILPTEILVPKLWCLTEEEINNATSGGRFEVNKHEQVHCKVLVFGC